MKALLLICTMTDGYSMHKLREEDEDEDWTTSEEWDEGEDEGR